MKKKSSSLVSLANFQAFSRHSWLAAPLLASTDAEHLITEEALLTVTCHCPQLRVLVTICTDTFQLETPVVSFGVTFLKYACLLFHFVQLARKAVRHFHEKAHIWYQYLRNSNV